MTTKLRGFRLTDDTFERITNLSNILGISQAKVVTKAVELLSQSDITDFEKPGNVITKSSPVVITNDEIVITKSVFDETATLRTPIPSLSASENLVPEKPKTWQQLEAEKKEALIKKRSEKDRLARLLDRNDIDYSTSQERD